MKPSATRREFVSALALAAAGSAPSGSIAVPPQDASAPRGPESGPLTPQENEKLKQSIRDQTVKVVVWDEQQPAQKPAYANFLGNQIAQHLAGQPGISVRSVNINDPGQGLDAGVLDDARVLIWWGHARHAEISPETGRSIVKRIKDGKLSLIALHSAHWSTPFVEAMNERTRSDFAGAVRADEQGRRIDVSFVAPAQRYTVPKREARLTPYVSWRKYPDGRGKASVRLPLCCFPAYRGDGKPSRVTVLIPDHPIAKGIPREFEIPQTEMYDEPFHVPAPDEVVFEERWETGEWFRSGALWKLGKGRVFYFRPGHETYPIFKQPIPLKILSNAVRWLGAETA
jgi:trehalose utilization protein